MVASSPPTRLRKRPSRLRRLANRTASIGAVALLLAGGVAAGTVTGAAPSAEAATLGPGYFPDNGLSPLGGFNNTIDGNISYCIDVGAEVPINNQTSDQGVVGQVNDLDADMMSRLNFVLTKFGNTTDNNQAAAVAMVVWGMADPADYAAEGGDPYVLGRAPSSEHAAIMAMVDSIRGEMGAFVPGAGGANTATLTLSVDPTNNYVGSLNVALDPGNATGTITLTNGVFDSTGTNTADVTGSTSLGVHGVPPTEDGAPYKISALGSFEGTGGPGPNVHLYTTPGSQNITGAGTTQPSAFSGATEDPQQRSVIFQPVATTKVSQQYLEAGDDITDLVQPRTTADATGLNNPWRQRSNGTYAEITYTGIAYGPFTEKPVESATAPAGAPVIGEATFTTTSTDGPNVSYSATADKKAPASGWITWVWSVEATNQKPVIQLQIPAGYSWADRFGQAIESALVIPTVVTQAKTDLILGVDTATDTATVTGVTPEGATLGFEAYYQAPGTDATCTTDTLVFTSEPTPVTGAGDYVSDEFTPTEAGTYFWVEQLEDAEGTVLHRGECGEPDETTVVTQLAVTTKAQATAVVGGTAIDTAVMTGTIKPGDVLTFQAYKQGDGAADKDHLVCDLSKKPLTLTPGVVNGFEITSDGCEFTEAGSYYWVETITNTPTGDIVHRGKPRLPNETTVVTPGPTTPPTPPTTTSLALTGATPAPLLGLAGGFLLVGLLTAGTMLTVQRRRDRVTAAQQ